MTHAEQILQAVAGLVDASGNGIFTREEVRHQAGVDRSDWNAGYSPTFQGMRDDHPGGAPRVGGRYSGVFERLSHGRYQLTSYGRQRVDELRGLSNSPKITRTQAHEDLLASITSGSVDDDLVPFQPSQGARQRVMTIVQLGKATGLTPAQVAELERYLQFEELIRRAEACSGRLASRG